MFSEGCPGDRLTGLEPSVHPPIRDDRHRVAGGVRPDERIELGVVDVDARAVRLEEPGGLVDDPLEHLGRIEDGRHASRDLPERPFRIGPAGDLGPRPFELLDEPGVGDGDRRLVGQGG